MKIFYLVKSLFRQNVVGHIMLLVQIFLLMYYATPVVHDVYSSLGAFNAFVHSDYADIVYYSADYNPPVSIYPLRNSQVGEPHWIEIQQKLDALSNVQKSSVKSVSVSSESESGSLYMYDSKLMTYISDRLAFGEIPEIRSYNLNETIPIILGAGATFNVGDIITLNATSYMPYLEYHKESAELNDNNKHAHQNTVHKIQCEVVGKLKTNTFYPTLHASYNDDNSISNMRLSDMFAVDDKTQLLVFSPPLENDTLIVEESAGSLWILDDTLENISNEYSEIFQKSIDGRICLPSTLCDNEVWWVVHLSFYGILRSGIFILLVLLGYISLISMNFWKHKQNWQIYTRSGMKTSRISCVLFIYSGLLIGIPSALGLLYTSMQYKYRAFETSYPLYPQAYMIVALSMGVLILLTTIIASISISRLSLAIRYEDGMI